MPSHTKTRAFSTTPHSSLNIEPNTMDSQLCPIKKNTAGTSSVNSGVRYSSSMTSQSAFKPGYTISNFVTKSLVEMGMSTHILQYSEGTAINWHLGYIYMTAMYQKVKKKFFFAYRWQHCQNHLDVTTLLSTYLETEYTIHMCMMSSLSQVCGFVVYTETVMVLFSKTYNLKPIFKSLHWLYSFTHSPLPNLYEFLSPAELKRYFEECR